MAKIRVLHQYGCKIDDEYDGLRPLHRAAKGKHAYAAHWLVTLGADTNNEDPEGWPVPHYAAKHCATEVIKVFRMKAIEEIYTVVQGKTTEDLAREHCDNAQFADMLGRWIKEKKEEAHTSFTA